MCRNPVLLPCRCLVYDCGSRNKTSLAPRAVWHGLEFLRYTLNLVWRRQRLPAYLRGYPAGDLFKQRLEGIRQPTLTKLKYYRRWLPDNAPEVRLFGVYKGTQHDSDTEYYRTMLRRYVAPSRRLATMNPTPEPTAPAGARFAGGQERQQAPEAWEGQKNGMELQQLMTAQAPTTIREQPSSSDDLQWGSDSSIIAPPADGNWGMPLLEAHGWHLFTGGISQAELQVLEARSSDASTGSVLLVPP